VWSEVEVGSNTFRNTDVILRIDDQNVLYVERGVRDSQLLLTARIYGPSGAELGRLRRNAWTRNNDDRLVLTTQPRRLSLRDSTDGRTLFRAEVISRDQIRVSEAYLHTPAGLLLITPEKIELPGNNILSGNIFDRVGGAAIVLSTKSR